MSDDGYLRIDHLSAEVREVLRRLTVTDAGMATLRALANLDSALAGELAANSNESRETARRAALAARDVVLQQIGVTDLEKRRLYVTATGGDEGAPATATDFDKIMRAPDRLLLAGKIRLNMAHARFALDNERLFGGHAAAALAAQRIAHNAGKVGPLDPGPGESVPPEIARTIDAVVGGRLAQSGIMPVRGDLDFVKLTIATLCGEEAFAQHGATGRIGEGFWGVMLRHCNKAMAEAEIPARGGAGFYAVKTGGALRKMIWKDRTLKDAFDKARLAKAQK